ncbi:MULTISPECIES: ParA family protein [Halococcus]|uniref:Cobyrinic acid ac-diamide synthase n=1 Tax=Halococcus saccharolyticus DSM 5350 TaxID=1227455 RepID=M0MCU6_9EURY|nr:MULTISPECIES: ParA family protein [Halococcus]EMA43582.1 Cobyrinic acid ac-diamide synthase [Halococcus saccharolyticus DSM 5350]
MENGESRAIAIANNKGGVGKTSISINLADRLAKRGHDVLVIDTDPSGNLTEGVGLKDAFQNGTHFGQFLDDDEDEDVGFSDIIVPGEETGLPFDVMPSHEDLAHYQTRIDSKRMSMTWMDEQIVQPLLEQVYDFIVIDTEASPDSLWMDSAIYAAGNVIVPLDDGGESVSGFEMLRDRQIDPIRKHRDVDILALVPNETSNNNELRELIEILEEQYPEYTPSFARIERFDDSVGPGIRDRIQIKRAWKDGIPLSEYEPDHEMIERFDVLADIAERGGVDG